MNVFRTRSLGLIANDTRLLHRQQNLLHHGCSRRVASESRTDRATRRQVATKTAASRSIKNSLATRDSIHAHKAGRARRMLSGSALPEDIMYLPMPKLSPSMAIIDHALPPKTTGTVTKWLKAEGDEINEYDAVLELSTDSLYAPGDAPTDGPVCMIVELAEAGFVGRLFAAEGDTVEVGHPIMSMCEENESLEVVRHAKSPGVNFYGDSPRLRIATFQGYLNGATPKR